MTTKIEILKSEIEGLKQELSQKEMLLQKLLMESENENVYSDGLSTDEVVRYSRQMIMPDVNVNGQNKLKKSHVLIVGIGGLGCPASLYLAAAGIGNITLIDYDEVELSNLHRQVLHSELDIGTQKVQSAYNKLKRINRNININPINTHVNSKTISNLVSKSKFDVIIDGSDNVATRYLLNDVCVLNNIPLVSGSALQMEGQLTVYNYKNGPCYRCLFPKPPPPQTVTNCGDGGVIGPVPGTIGVLQALETIKILTDSPGVLSGRLLLFDGSTTIFRNVKLRERSKTCDICGENPTVTKLIDYEQFCGSSAHDKVHNINILNNNENVTVQEFSKIKKKLILDVRPELEYKMCRLPNTVNVPYTNIEKGKCWNVIETLLKNLTDNDNVYVLCRRGNDSQRAVAILKEKFNSLPVTFVNINGGLHAYSKHIDHGFPVY